MRILMICQRDDPASGGAARVAVEFTKRIPNFGVEASCVFVYGNQGSLSLPIREQTEWLRVPSSRHALKGIMRLRRVIRETKPDVIYHHDGLMWTHLVSWFFRRKTLIIGHAHLDGPQPNSSWKRNLAHWVHTHTYKQLIAVSNFTRECWIKRGYPENNSIVIPNGVDGQLFSPSTYEQRKNARARFDIPNEAKVLLSVGRLHCDMKGTDDFLQVLSSLSPHWHGLVAGSGPDLDLLKLLSNELGVSSRVHFAGLVDPVFDAYHAADVLAITSRYEPFGLMAVEALSSGIPVVSFACRGGVTEILTSVGETTIEGRDTHAMAQAIDYASIHSLPKRNMVLERYSWDVSAESLVTQISNWIEIMRSH